jgi:hypothetical protein
MRNTLTANADLIVTSLEAWAQYAVNHLERFEAPIGSDYYFGPVWHAWGRALHDTLNGDTGNLDCGKLSQFFYATLHAHGFSDDGETL